MTSAVVVRAPAGLGKTTQVLKAIAQGDGGPFELYVPTHALAEEMAKNLRAENPQLRVKVMAGRSHVGDDGEALCKKHKLAEEVARAGGEVYTSLCAQEKGNGEERCQHYSSCPYIAQFTPAQVTIYTHAHLPLERMRLEPGVPEIAVIDEAFFLSCVETLYVPAALLRAPFLGRIASRVCVAIEDAMTQGASLQTLLQRRGTPDDCKTVFDEIKKGAPSMSPTMSKKKRSAALHLMRQLTQVRKLLENVYRESITWRLKGECHCLKYCPATGEIAVHTKKPIHRFIDRRGDEAGVHNEARVLIIDANANQQIVGQFFDVAWFHTIQATRQVEVIQCRSTRGSKTSLVPKRNEDPKSKRAAQKRLRELQAFIARLATQHPRLLVVGPQEITGNPKSKVKPLIKVPANVDLAHFNAIRGIDRWKDHDAIVVIGRNEPPVEAVEAIARCVFLTDREPLCFDGEWAVEERGYRLKGARRGVDVIRHADARVQAVLEQLREGESQQAIDRLRLVHAASPKRAYILSNVVLDVDVHRLVTWDEMMNGGGRLEQAWNTLQGVMPLAPAWLAAQFPQLWKTVDAAKADVANAGKECQFTNIYSISNPTLFRHQYCPNGQRAWSVCLSRDADPIATRVALEALLGREVEMRPSKAAPSMPERRPKYKALTTPSSGVQRHTKHSEAALKRRLAPPPRLPP